MKLKLLIMLLFPLLCFGQSQKQLIKYADENASLGDFYGASIYYKQALRLDSSNIHLLYKYAESLRRYNNYDLASYYYNKIVEKDKAGRIYEDAWFWFASMQKYNGDYQASMKC
jgi:tetratricopeptide (TPR) repeat protein